MRGSDPLSAASHAPAVRAAQGLAQNGSRGNERDARAEARVFRSKVGSHLFVVDGSRVYDLPDEVVRDLERALIAGEDDAPMRALLDELAGADGRRIDLTAPEPPPLFSLSLNVAQTCNMSCGYCYADRGKFGWLGAPDAVRCRRRQRRRRRLEARPNRLFFDGDRRRTRYSHL